MTYDKLHYSIREACYDFKTRLISKFSGETKNHPRNRLLEEKKKKKKWHQIHIKTYKTKHNLNPKKTLTNTHRTKIKTMRAVPSKGEVAEKRASGQVAKEHLKLGNKGISIRPSSWVPGPAIMTTVGVCIATRKSRRGGGGSAIVEEALAVVGKDLVGIGNLLESERGAVSDGLGRLCVLVRMIFQSQFPKRFLDFIFAGVSPDPQHFVVIHDCCTVPFSVFFT